MLHEMKLNFFHLGSGQHHVTGLIDIMRHQDNVIAILPYHRHQDFRSYIDTMTVEDYRPYLTCLCEALHWCHENKIVHRDIKPANFLYHPRRKVGVLVDFGLAQVLFFIFYIKTEQDSDVR